MRSALWGIVAVAALWACGGQTFAGPGDGGGDGGSSSGSSGGGSGGSGSSSGGSSGGSGSSSGASSSGSSGGGSGSGSSSGGVAPLNHRPDDSQCLQPAPPGDCNFGGGGGPPTSCTMDSQCADAGVNGRCVNFGGGPAGCFCTSDTCADDGACSPGQTCACHGSPYNQGRGNACVPGNCRVDSDCGPGGWCSPSSDTMSCGGIGGYYCHTSHDECVNDSDCADAGGYELCAYDSTLGHWRCTMQGLCAYPKG